jgi:hypothetical protein
MPAPPKTSPRRAPAPSTAITCQQSVHTSEAMMFANGFTRLMWWVAHGKIDAPWGRRGRLTAPFLGEAAFVILRRIAGSRHSVVTMDGVVAAFFASSSHCSLVSKGRGAIVSQRRLVHCTDVNDKYEHGSPYSLEALGWDRSFPGENPLLAVEEQA